MYLISQTTGITTLLIFGLVMIVIVYFLTRKQFNSKDAFLVARREVGWLRGSLSIAVSWIWAPAVFIASMQAYNQGIAGAFWFIVPNVVCFFVFAPLAIRLRRFLPEGYTLPQFILKRYDNDKKTHLAFLVLFFGYQLGAIIINTLAAGVLLNALTGISFYLVVSLIMVLVLIYAIMSGLEASIITDVIQMAMVLLFCFILVPWVIIKAGGFSAVTGGFGGITGMFGNVFNPWIAYSFGIATTLSLISGPIGDQMFFQRVYASKKEQIVKTFVAGGLIFGLVPTILCLLGFIAANPHFSSLITVADPQMVGPVVIGYFLPKIALVAFLFMAFAALASTIDSAYCAISSLGTIDIYRKYFNPEASDRQLLSMSRKVMLAMALLGTGIALLQPKLLWVFLIYGALASAGFFPTVFSLYWKKLNKQGVFWAVTLSLIIGLPLSIYANITENVNLIVLASILSVVIGLITCLIAGFLNKKTVYNFASGEIEAVVE
jgi:SSS family transporter